MKKFKFILKMFFLCSYLYVLNVNVSNSFAMKECQINQEVSNEKEDNKILGDNSLEKLEGNAEKHGEKIKENVSIENKNNKISEYKYISLVPGFTKLFDNDPYKLIDSEDDIPRDETYSWYDLNAKTVRIKEKKYSDYEIV